MSNTQKEENPVLVAVRVLIDMGMIESAERSLVKKLGITASEATDLVNDAYVKIVGSAPKELRPSFESVISYHRWNRMYQQATKKKNNEMAAAAQKQIDALMTRVH